MAWIKVDHTTPHKPEVLRLARILGVGLDDALGKVVRFWIWLDQISVDGVVDALVDADVDAVVSHIGFARALQSVGWLVIDEDGGVVSVPNFDRHNGESAKKRGEKALRQARWRKSVDADVGARVDALVDAPASRKAPPEKEKSKSKRKSKAAAAADIYPSWEEEQIDTLFVALESRCRGEYGLLTARRMIASAKLGLTPVDRIASVVRAVSNGRVKDVAGYLDKAAREFQKEFDPDLLSRDDYG